MTDEPRHLGRRGAAELLDKHPDITAAEIATKADITLSLAKQLVAQAKRERREHDKDHQ